MADYRGGDAGQSGVGQRAVHNISTGNTPGERARQLNQKLIKGVAEAGLTGLAGYIKGEVGKDQENSAKRKIMADAIANAKRASAHQQAATSNSYHGNAEGPQPKENYGYTPKGGFDGPYQGYGTKSVEDAGKAGMQQDDTNKAAAGAPVTWGTSKQYTPAGLDDKVANGQVAGQDHQYLKGLAKDADSMLAQVEANKSMLGTGPSVGNVPSLGEAHSGGDISRDNPYNVPMDGPAVNPELGNTSTGWAPTDEELSGMGQSKRGF